MITPAAIIETEKLCCEIGGRAVLNDVSFFAKPGEYISVIGPNGAGKTTLIQRLDRLLPFTSGNIFIEGRPIKNYSSKALAKLMSYVPQANGDRFSFTVRQFVMMGRYSHLSPFSSVSDDDRRVVADALELTGLSEFSERPVNTLSGGERQKAYIAAALAQQAKIMLLDEPATFLDPRRQMEVEDILRTLNRQKSVTIISATHDVNSAVQLSDRILALKEGKTVFDGAVDKIFDGDTLENIFERKFHFIKDERFQRPLVIPVGQK